MTITFVFLIDALRFVLLRVTRIRTLGSWSLIGFSILWFHSLSMLSWNFLNGSFVTILIMFLFGCLIALLLLSTISLFIVYLKLLNFVGTIDWSFIRVRFQKNSLCAPSAKLFHYFDYLRDNSQINYAFQPMKMSWMV